MAKFKAKVKTNPKPKKQLDRYHRPPGVPVDPDALLRVAEVLRLLPISRSTWCVKVRRGEYPAPIKLGPHTTCWRARDVLALAERA
jgi:prophage regulatory protein